MNLKRFTLTLKRNYVPSISILFMVSIFSFVILREYLNRLEVAQLLDVYGNEIQITLFISLVVIAAFIFSLKPLIVLHLKENVYDKDEYKDHVKERNEKLGKHFKVYAPLRRLSKPYV